MTSVLLRNIPVNCQEGDLRRALLIYGTAVNISIMHHVNQATVTMRSVQEARSLLHQGCINVLGQSVIVESAVIPSPTASARINVTVERCTYPVTKEILAKVFGMVAPPVNVVCGPSAQTTTGFVDYADVATARRVVQQLNKNSIYPDCCFMTLTLEHLAPPAPSVTGYTAPQVPFAQQQQQQQSMQQMPFGHSTYGAMPGCLVPRGGMSGRGRGRGGRGGAGRYGSHYAANGPMAPQFYPVPAATTAPAAAPVAFGSYSAPSSDAVVIISNMPETVALHDLWVLLEVYGNVNSLKRQFSSKSTVVAHFQNVYDARLAVQHLQGCPFYGATLSLKHFAGYVERGGRTEWNSGPATDPATHAVLFFSGYHHRTKPTAAFNPTGRVRLGKNLFISNLTETITDDDIKEVFTKAGFELDGYYRKTPSVAIVSLADIDTAVRALIAVHSQQLKGRFLRVTFSHFSPGQRANGEEENENPTEEPKDNAPESAMAEEE